MISQPKPIIVGIMGSPIASGNRGVLALGSSLANLCLEHTKAGEVVILTGNRGSRTFKIRHRNKEIDLRVVNFRLSPKANPREHLACIVTASLLYRYVPSLRTRLKAHIPWIKTVSETTFVGDVRGGDSFSDIYGLKRFLVSFLPSWSIILIKGSIVHFPQTYGPYKSSLARWLAAFLLRRSSTIIARDAESQSIAQSLIRPNQQVRLSPDVAFSLDAIQPDSIDSIPANTNLPDASCIGINVNGLMYNGGYNRSNMFGLRLDYPSFLEQLVIKLLETQSGDLWILPHTYAPVGNVESDNEASLKLRQQIPPDQRHRVRALTSELDQYEIKGLIGMCGFFIGSRMHSCIAALSQGVPCVGVAYSMKFQGVFDSVGVGTHVVDGRKCDNEQAVEKCLELYHNRNSVRKELEASVSEAKSALSKTFTDMGAD